MGLLPFPNRRARPYLYTNDEIHHLMAIAKALPPRDGLRGWTYYCLFGLLTVTGLRISELIALERCDVDLQEGLLTIRGAKFDKSRMVPLHASTRAVLQQYALRCDACVGRQSTGRFLVSQRGQPLDASTVRRTFYGLSHQTGLRGEGDRNGPRLHLRHFFASVLIENGESPKYIQDQIGHASITMTFDIYGHLMPQAKQRATKKLELSIFGKKADVRTLLEHSPQKALPEAVN